MPTVPAVNISDAWQKVVRLCLEAKEHEVPALTVEIDVSKGLDNSRFQQSLDRVLVANGKGKVGTVSRTIFPDGLWNPLQHRSELFQRYLRILPKLRKCPQNRRGHYFERLIAYPSDRNNTRVSNQLDFIINTFLRRNHRRTALQCSLYNPFLDASHSPRLGFPCLQQVSFIPSKSKNLTILGYYPLHYIFERAYGNYLGLARLGLFMAHEMGLKLKNVICTAGVAKFEVSSAKIKSLKII